MVDEHRIEQLVKLAQEGRQQAREALSREGRSKVYVFIYRATLDEDLAQELTQETLLQMLRSIGDLKDANGFWSWLYSIAYRKIQQYHRDRKKKAAISASVLYQDFLSQQPDKREDGGLRRLLKKELSQAVFASMSVIKREYRSVLSLRCYENMPYDKIAVVMGCTQTRARVLFYRAKRAFRKELLQRGVSGTLTGISLGLFGGMTTAQKGASGPVTVAASATKVGLTGAFLAAVTTKLGVSIVALLAIVGAVGGYKALSSGRALPEKTDVKSFSYTVLEPDYDASPFEGSLQRGAFEQFYYLPGGLNGPIFMRMQRWDSKRLHKLCAWLQNDEGNYYYEPTENTVYINNYRLCMSDLSVRRLPTDSTEFISFIEKVQGEKEDINYTRDSSTGLVVKAVDRRFPKMPLFQTSYHYNTCSPEMFDYKWSDYSHKVDQRDEMHRRGWTYFRIKGRLGERKISGSGRIPFVYDAYKQKRPWLHLSIGEKLRIIDRSDGAWICNQEGDVIASYPPGSFFKGLPRPWMGMHTVDIIRRDAARKRIWFDTSVTDEGKAVRVSFYNARGSEKVELVYKIDLSTDIINSIEFRANERYLGKLRFTYLQDVAGAGDDFVAPAAAGAAEQDLNKPLQQSRGMLWLFCLIDGDFANTETIMTVKQ